VTATASRLAATILLLLAVATWSGVGHAQPLVDGDSALERSSEKVETPGQADATEAQRQGTATGDTAAAPEAPSDTTTTTSDNTDMTTPLAVPVAAIKQNLSSWSVTLDRATASLQREGLSRAELTEIQLEVESLRLDSINLTQATNPSVQALEARLAQLAPVKEGTIESDDVKTARLALEQQTADLKGLVQQIKVITLRAEELIIAIDSRKRAMFTERLFEHNQSIIDPRIWVQAANDMPHVLRSILLLASDWRGLVAAKIGTLAVFLFSSLAIVIFVLISLTHRFLLRRTKRNAAIETPSLLNKAWSALVIFVVNLILPLLGAALFFLSLEALGVSPNRIDNLAWNVGYTVLTLSAAHGLIRAVLAPGRGNWRLVPLTDPAAERLAQVAMLIGIALAINIFIGGVLRDLLAPTSILHVVRGSLAIVFHILTLWALRIISNGRKPPEAEAETQGYGRARLWRWVVPIAWIGSLIGLVATIVGFLSFGWFIAIQIIWGAAVLSLLHLLLIFVDELFTTGLYKSTFAGGVLSPTQMGAPLKGEQIGVILSGAVRLLLIGSAAFLLLTPWGVQSARLFSSVEAVFFGIEVGEMTFSLSAILTAVAIFSVGAMVARAIQRWVETKLLPSTSLDIGLQMSIKTAIGYVGIIIAGMVAFSYVGLDLQNIAIVAGALSVGVGFGLQSIVNNFVSGLILLAERPIKVGDWIVVGSEQGYVRRINVRATEIETFDRASVIVPNSDLISGVVKNWMHNDATGRIIIPVGVAYGTDPDQVRSLLLECAREQRMVLAYPAPSVYFMAFGDSSLNFELRCYLSEVDYSLSVSSEIRFAIYRRFGEAGIEIPFPQRDINLRDMSRLENLFKPAGDAPKGGDSETDK